MFCELCKDTGKTETEYTSHNIKDKTGKTTCPTLLNQSCKYYKHTGHTVKFFQTLKKNKRRKEYFKKPNPKKNTDTRRFGSSFATIFESELEDEYEVNDMVSVINSYAC